VVIDHTGGFDVAAGVDAAGFRCLLSLVESGHVWVKLCAYRNLLAVQDKSMGRPFHRALVAANPQRLVWGTDWPHLRVTPEPDTSALLAHFKELVHKILVTNPTALYD
jgi:predicted TIM-barrel fold metal-dependent hydrolase